MFQVFTARCMLVSNAAQRNCWACIFLFPNECCLSLMVHHQSCPPVCSTVDRAALVFPWTGHTLSSPSVKVVKQAFLFTECQQWDQCIIVKKTALNNIEGYFLGKPTGSRQRMKICLLIGGLIEASNSCIGVFNAICCWANYARLNQRGLNWTESHCGEAVYLSRFTEWDIRLMHCNLNTGFISIVSSFLLN